MKLINLYEDGKTKSKEQINNIMSTLEGITTDPMAFKDTIQECCKQLNSHILCSFKDQFPATSNYQNSTKRT